MACNAKKNIKKNINSSNRLFRPDRIQKKSEFFVPLFYYKMPVGHHLIISRPIYGTNTFGTRMPSGVWLFSSMVATMRGSAKADPLSV